MKLEELATKQVIDDEVIDHFDDDFYGDFYDFFDNRNSGIHTFYTDMFKWSVETIAAGSEVRTRKSHKT